MSPSIGVLLAPPGPADPYDVPASPLKRSDGANTPNKVRVLTPARDIGRDIARAIDRSTEVTVVAARSEPEEDEQPASNDSIDSKPLQENSNDSEPEAKPEATEAPTAEPNTPAKTDLGEVEIESFEGHRVDENNSTVEILVKWVNGEKTWEPEWSLQHQVSQLIYKYWDGLDGRETATGLDIYHVFRILKRATPPRAKKNKFMYQVQWVGYRRTDATWEHESKIKEIAPDELIKFEAKNGVASEAPAQKRGVARGPGRPRKKAKLDD